MLELPSSFGLHSTDIRHGFPYGLQQGPRAVTGVETHLGEGTPTGPPGTSSVGPCDNPWCDGQLNQYATHSSASQGWHTAVNAFVFREQICYYQHFHPRNKKCCMKAHPHLKSFSFSKRSTDQDNSGWGWWTAGSWLKALLHLLSAVLTSKLLGWLGSKLLGRLPGETSTHFPASTPTLHWTEPRKTFRLSSLHLSLFPQPTSC